MILFINAREKVSTKSRWLAPTNTQEEELVLRWFAFRNIKILPFLFIWTLCDLENESSTLKHLSTYEARSNLSACSFKDFTVRKNTTTH